MKRAPNETYSLMVIRMILNMKTNELWLVKKCYRDAFTSHIYIYIYIYNEDLALNNLQ